MAATKFVVVAAAILFVGMWFPVGAAAQGCCAPAFAEESSEPGVIFVSETATLEVPTLRGDTFTLLDSSGRPTVVFVMAYWCATCFHEAGELATLREKYGNRVAIVALDVDPTSNVEKLSRFRERVRKSRLHLGIRQGRRSGSEFSNKSTRDNADI